MDARGVSPAVEARDLKVHFSLLGGGLLKAVDGVSFEIGAGRTLGLVGESGCGKSTTGRALLGMYEPTGGEVRFEGKDIAKMSGLEKTRFTRYGQMIFQDPYSSLNPRMTVADIVGEGIDIHRIYRGRERMDRIHELLSMVGLERSHGDRFPHEFSGGQRQRIGIARALAVEPSFVVCDEPISALDVSIQSQIVNLLMDLQGRLSLTYLFISHDLSMVKYICERVAVMYLGVIVELAASDQLYRNPRHPYTRALLSAIPVADPVKERARTRVVLEGDVPSPIDPPPGCRFAGRCPVASARCAQTTPEWREIDSGHFTACWREGE
ncbi:MAG: ATP-binding cassette domain-containing protein [Synergistaceae bacterium]|jgi:oligopeptide transport system ATP-binding protein|nr:ATP-binding cassette domain-containing protein [Synergistaceae bacterium]